MPRDNKLQMLQNKRYQKKKQDNSDQSESDDSSYHTDDSEPEDFDRKKYHKFLAKLFPSKHMDQKVKEDEKKIKPKSKKYVSSEEEDTYESEELGSEDTWSEEEEEEEASSSSEYKSKKNNFNLILTIGSKKEDEYSEEWSTCSNSDTENEDDPISSDSSDEEDKDNIKQNKDKNKNKKNDKDEKKEKKRKEENEEIKEQEQEEKSEVLKNLEKMLEDNPKDKSIQKCIKLYKEDIKIQKEKQDKKDKKEKERNERIFRKIIHDKNTDNDFEFYNKMDISEQKRIIKELREINKVTRVEKPYRLSLLEANIPVQFKAAAFKKINSLRHMEPGSGEYYKIKNWVDTFMRIPFGKYCNLPLTIENGVNECHEFMENALKTLDNAVYGLNDAKMQIMQMLGQLLTNPKAIGSAIAIHGPPGTGKTSIVKEGISKILNRPFAFIALGGATDSSFLEGHGYTYEGSTWGKIVQILIDSKCMNPVIYFDELDKISDTPKGEEIAGILTHLTDTTQNSQFHDKYFSEIDFDLSKCLFIFSYNDESKVNPILKDRMYRIETKGYNYKQKINIANNYLLPKIREQVKFSNEDIIIPEKTIQYLFDNFCNKEDGVRNLKRCLEIIHTKLNLYRLMKPGSNLFEQDMSIKVEFPFIVTSDIVDKLIKKADTFNPSLYHLYT